MDATTLLVIALPILIVGEGMAALLVWRLTVGSKARRTAALSRDMGDRLTALASVALVWLLLTGLTVWWGFLVALVAVHVLRKHGNGFLAAFAALQVLLFWPGAVAAWLGIFVFAAALLAVPATHSWVAVPEVRTR